MYVCMYVCMYVFMYVLVDFNQPDSPSTRQQHGFVISPVSVSEAKASTKVMSY